jgi:DnaJ domain
MTATQVKDYYVILGIAPDATARQVKAAYRKLAKKNHPDACPGDPDAAARFRDITEAYETLTDPDRRKAYDRTCTPPPGSGMTPPGETPAASRLLTVLEDTWTAIRRHHGEIPPAVIIIASGTASKQARWGHHAPGRWHHNGTDHAEVMISGEGLRREPAQVLGTLLHEAAHALAGARGITDTSRQGRYHNKKYALLAKELGLDVAEDTQFGWTVTTVPGATAARYASRLAAIADAMTLWRKDEHHARTVTRDTNLIAASCPCGRKIRVAASTLKEAPIQCQACDGTFEPASTL